MSQLQKDGRPCPQSRRGPQCHPPKQRRWKRRKHGRKMQVAWPLSCLRILPYQSQPPGLAAQLLCCIARDAAKNQVAFCAALVDICALCVILWLVINERTATAQLPTKFFFFRLLFNFSCTGTTQLQIVLLPSLPFFMCGWLGQALEGPCLFCSRNLPSRQVPKSCIDHLSCLRECTVVNSPLTLNRQFDPGFQAKLCTQWLLRIASLQRWQFGSAWTVANLLTSGIRWRFRMGFSPALLAYHLARGSSIGFLIYCSRLFLKWFAILCSIILMSICRKSLMYLLKFINIY